MPSPCCQAVIKKEYVHNGPETFHKEAMFMKINIKIDVCVGALKQCAPGLICFP